MSKPIIDKSFNFYSDATGHDPDNSSPTLKKYHQLLWSKPLPNGQQMELKDGKSHSYLYCEAKEQTHYFGSDAIVASYRDHKNKRHIIQQVSEEAQELYDKGSTIGAYIIFPNNSIERQHTINQARGVKSIISDRFDLTLECIKRYYMGQKSPLFDTFNRYKSFFDLFVNFKVYVDFFLLQDLVNENYEVKFYLPFDDFKTKPNFIGPLDYMMYQKEVLKFIQLRNNRIEEFAKTI